ncbi:ESCRT-III subunit protein did4 [Globomyces sp. JEL0801]|nr:ESCRT-III subunit protein did4 [Globomyces sp. JEL0801]
MMDFLFGSRKTPQEMLKQNQRALNKAQRDLDRERTKLEAQEKKLIADIKKSAKANQMGACKVMAKDLVRTRRYIQKFYQTRTQVQAISLQIQTFQSNQQMATAMKGVTKALASMNKGANLPQISKIMEDFARESEMMDMKQEVMNDAMDDAMEDEDDEEETDQILSQVLDEIGIDMNQKLSEAPAGTGKLKTTEKPMVEDDLQARLDSLRKE